MIEKNSIKLPLDGVLRLQKTLLMVTLELGGIKKNAACPGGEPRDINTTIGAWGREEQWCYYDSYLYLKTEN